MENIQKMTETCPTCLYTIKPATASANLYLDTEIDIPDIMLTKKPCYSIDMSNYKKLKIENVKLRAEADVLYLEPAQTNLVHASYKPVTIGLSVLVVLLLLGIIYLLRSRSK